MPLSKLHGAAAALSPAGAGMGQVAGYTVADYLLQHASRERRYCPRARQHLGRPAQPHPRSRRRRPARRQRRGAGCCTATPSRSTVTLPTPATGPPPCSWPSCWPSAGTWTRLSLRARADAGDEYAAWPAGRACWPSCGDLDGLRARADAGDGYAAGLLADLLAGRGDLDAAARPGRRRRPDAAERLAGLLDRARGPGRAARPGRRRRRARRPAAGRSAGQDAGTWTGHVLRARADAGDGYAAAGLSPRLLAERGDLDGLRARADAGDGYAAGLLAELLARRGDLDELRARADAGDGTPPRAGRAAGRARRPGRRAGLRSRADAGDGDAASSWPGCWPGWGAGPGRAGLARPGRCRRLGRRRGAGPAAGRPRRLGRAARPRRRRRLACRRPAGQTAGRPQGPGRSSAAAPMSATERRRGAGPPAGQGGDLDQLRARADAGDWYAATSWPGCWSGTGTWTRPSRSAAPGPTPARGTPPRLAWLLEQQGQGEEAEQLRRFGLNPDGSIACG